MPGVVGTMVGYTGGETSSPSYGSVCGGDGHTEALKVTFDPAVVSFEKLLDTFLSAHDPCVSTSAQYQSAVWPTTETQKTAVLAALTALEQKRGRPVYTKIAAPKTWHDAEWYHRRYHLKNKLRLGAAAGVFVLNNMPHGSFPGQEALKTLLGGAVFLSLVPQLVAPFDELLAIFD